MSALAPRIAHGLSPFLPFLAVLLAAHVAIAPAGASAQEQEGERQDGGQESREEAGQADVLADSLELARGLEDDGYPGGPVYVTDLDSLRRLGPVYTPYDRSPVLRPGDWLRNLLRDTLVPVIERHDIPSDASARFWVLVDRNGRVAEVVLHLTSGHDAFDQAARAAARFLRYRPARRDGEWVPVWVLTPISLLMR